MNPGGSAERGIAARILAETETGRRLDVAWEAAGANGCENRAWLRHLVYGTVRLRGRLDHVLARFSSRPVEQLDPPVRTALRLGAFQLLYMGSVPSYAAVSESVALVKASASRGAAGLVNAVLRRVAEVERVEELFPAAETDLLGFLTRWGSHPEWLVRRWLTRFGEVATRALVEANNEEPDVYLNPVGLSSEEARRKLGKAGINASPVPDSDSLRLPRGADPAHALAQVPAVIQDPAASWVTAYASPGPGTTVADLCAAPGGKALALSGEGRRVVAADLSRLRLDRVREGADRLGTAVWPVVADARRPPVGVADLTLVDAPCTGTGTLRRHPDARWRVVPGDVARLAELQRAILAGAAALVPRDGLLVYATCTLEDEENVAQVTAFLDQHPDFRVEAGPGPPGSIDDRGCLLILPHQSGFDGAFAARLRRVEA